MARPWRQPSRRPTTEDASAITIVLTATRHRDLQSHIRDRGRRRRDCRPIVNQELRGRIANNDSATVTFTPTSDFNGTSSFTYTANDGTATSAPATVTITVLPVNDAPTATGTTVTTNEDNAAPVNLGPLVADVETADANLNYAIVTAPTKGVLSGTAPNLTYTPNLNANGADSFQYTVTDRGDPDVCGAPVANVCTAVLTSGTATVLISITPVNDVPDAASQSVATPEDTAKTITLSGTDIESNMLFSIVTPPSAGTLSAIGPSSCSGVSVKTCTTNVSYTPNLNANGSDSFTFKVNDGTVDSAAATVSITVTEVNDIPVANGDSITVLEDSGTTAVDVLANDSAGPANEGGQVLTIQSVSIPTSGTAEINGTKIDYTPPADFHGAASFTYIVCDNGTTNGSSDPKCTISGALVNVTVSPVNDPPILAPIGDKSVAEGSALDLHGQRLRHRRRRSHLQPRRRAGRRRHRLDLGRVLVDAHRSPGPGRLHVHGQGHRQRHAEPVRHRVDHGQRVGSQRSARSRTDRRQDRRRGQSADLHGDGHGPGPPGQHPDLQPGRRARWRLDPSDVRRVLVVADRGTRPGTFTFGVTVTDNGSPNLSDSESITVTVTEVNQAPVLDAIPAQTVNEASELTFTATASDPDLPANGRTFSLTGAPADATIDPTTGAFSWTPADDGSYSVTVVVTDSGVPPMSDSQLVSITVANVAPTISQVTAVADDRRRRWHVHHHRDGVGRRRRQRPAVLPVRLRRRRHLRGRSAGSNQAVCTLPDGDKTVSVGVRVTDGDGGADTSSVDVEVDNVAPTIGGIARPPPSTRAPRFRPEPRLGRGSRCRYRLARFSIDWGDGSAGHHRQSARPPARLPRTPTPTAPTPTLSRSA